MSIDWAPSFFGETFVMRGPDGAEITLVRADAAFAVLDRLECERDAMRRVVEAARTARRAWELAQPDRPWFAPNEANYADMEAALRPLFAAVDTYETQENTDG